jgi:hypothetical protein
MASDNSVHSRTPKAFGDYTLAAGRGVNIAATGNAIVSLPFLDGGLTNSGSNVTSGACTIRRITVGNYSSGNCAALNVSVGWTNDGGNLVAAAQLLTSITANNQWQDLTLNATGNNTFLNGNVSSVLYLNVVANAVANGTIDVLVQGQTFRS